VIWYECSNGEKALRLVNFEKHQKGLRKDREAVSKYDDPNECKILGAESEKTVKNLKEKNNTKSNRNVNLNSNSGVEAGVRRDLVGSEENTNRSPLLETFEQETKIFQPAEIVDPGGFISWEREIKKWEDMKATVQDVKDGINKADELKTNLAWPGSITKYMRSAIARRERGVSDKPKQNESVDEMLARLKAEEQKQLKGVEVIDG
jgi:hypothetical protein